MDPLCSLRQVRSFLAASRHGGKTALRHGGDGRAMENIIQEALRTEAMATSNKGHRY